MWFFITVILIAVLGTIIVYNSPEGHYGNPSFPCFIGLVISVPAFGTLLIFIIATLVTRSEWRSRILIHESMVSTIAESRKIPNNRENSGLVGRIINWNADLAAAQYWNKNSVFDLMYPDEIMELQPLK